MAADLAGTPTSGITVQLCGDAHLGNFGGFAAPGRRMVFDVRDFDETLPGPWEWDVKRLAASTEVAARERSFSAADRADAVHAAVMGYAAAMRRLAGMRTMEVWYSRTEVDTGLREWVRGLRQVTDRAEEAVDDVTTTFVGDVLRTYRPSLTGDRRRLLASYRVVGVARAVGGGAWIVRLLGRDGDDPLVLQLKEAGPSVLEAHLGPYVSDNGARRVVEGQRMIQSATDVLLGWARIDGRDLYVRQLWDAKLSVPIEVLPPPELATYAATCGEALAPGTRTLGRPVRDRGLPGARRALRRRARALRGGVRRPERDSTTPRSRRRSRIPRDEPGASSRRLAGDAGAERVLQPGELLAQTEHIGAVQRRGLAAEQLLRRATAARSGVPSRSRRAVRASSASTSRITEGKYNGATTGRLRIGRRASTRIRSSDVASAPTLRASRARSRRTAARGRAARPAAMSSSARRRRTPAAAKSPAMIPICTAAAASRSASSSVAPARIPAALPVTSAASAAACARSHRMRSSARASGCSPPSIARAAWAA